ncbi:MAG: hypothetical protein WA210_09095 [Burkholderiaceae bacterium]
MNLLTPPDRLGDLTDVQLAELMAEMTRFQAADRQEWQILYYQPVSPRAMLVHESAAKLIGVSGGNGSSKTESCLVELVARATGIFPRCFAHTAKQKWRGPISCRVVVESLTTTLENIILPKLNWSKWTGLSMLDQSKGHWGWIPKACLIDEDWNESWSAKLRTLTVLCRDPEDHTKVIGESTIQFMAHSQDPSDFASGDFHIVLLDEPPREPIFRENQARTMRVDGTLMLAMTWPDDPTIPVDWIHDEIYEKATAEPKDPNIDWHVLWTEENQFINQEAVSRQRSQWDERTRAVRLRGESIRFANRVHSLFTKRDTHWCFKCGANGFAPVTVGDDTTMLCAACGSDDIDSYCHVAEFDAQPNWPTIRLLDPHPRKPNHFLWCQVDPADDIWVVQEAMLENTAVECKIAVDRIERELRLRMALGLIDPNMGLSAVAPTRNRDLTWQQEFRDAGLDHELANDSDVGRGRVDEFLRPDPATRQPRMLFHQRCKTAILHMERFTWDEHKRGKEADQKQTTKKKYDDFPALLRYLMNYQPTFKLLHYGAPTIRREGRRRGY